MRGIETEGVAGAFALHAGCAALCEAIEIVEQGEQVRELCDDGVEGFVADGVAVGGVGVCVSQTENLSRAVVDQQVHALLDDGDVGEELDASGLARVQVRYRAWIAEGRDHPADIVTREFPDPRDGIEREQHAQESVEKLGHGWEYMPAWGDVSSAGVRPPFLRAKALAEWENSVLRPADWGWLRPTVQPLVSARSSFDGRASAMRCSG